MCQENLEFNDFLNLQAKKLLVDLKRLKPFNSPDDPNSSKNRASLCSALSEDQESVQIKPLTERR